MVATVVAAAVVWWGWRQWGWRQWWWRTGGGGVVMAVGRWWSLKVGGVMVVESDEII